jgi:hypothetical protein
MRNVGIGNERQVLMVNSLDVSEIEALPLAIEKLQGIVEKYKTTDRDQFAGIKIAFFEYARPTVHSERYQEQLKKEEEITRQIEASDEVNEELIDEGTAKSLSLLSRVLPSAVS